MTRETKKEMGEGSTRTRERERGKKGMRGEEGRIGEGC
jgi:hypothetical protein